jgi:4-amino-4-deoxy-L-arabinose transferase-like glycosyltransferase
MTPRHASSNSTQSARPASPPADDRAARPAISRNEALLVAAIVALAFALRLAWPGRIALEHWDEAVYASNLLADGGYPMRHLYAPPLWPATIEFSMIAWGPSSLAAVLPNLVYGTLMVVLAWWAAREWFGPAAGVAAAILAATSDFAIAFDRTALTDTSLVFWFLLAVYLGWRAIADIHWASAVFAGLAVAAAWATKYNGWLPLAVLVSGFAAWLIFEKDRSGWQARLGILATIGAVAAVCWSPVLFGLQDVGGYAAVAENHARYFVGPAGWRDSLYRQLANLRAFDGWPSRIGFVAALAVVVGGRWRRELWCLVGVGIPALYLGTWPFVVGFGLAGPLVVLGAAIRPPRDDDAPRRLGRWLIAAWLVGLFVSTPAYTAYPRLLFPWLVAAWLAVAMVGAQAVWEAEVLEMSRSQRRFLIVIFAVAWTFIVAVMAHDMARSWPPTPRVPGWQDRTGRERAVLAAVEAAQQSLEKQQRPGQPLFLVYGEPALFFHLRSRGQDAIVLGGLDATQLRDAAAAVEGPLFLVTYATQEVAALPASGPVRLEPVAELRDSPSDIVLLDSYPPAALADPARRPTETLRLYRVVPR